MPSLKTARRLRFVLLVGLVALPLSTYFPIPASKFAFQEIQSVRIVDRNGVLLRELLSPRQGYGHWTSLEDVSPAFIKAILAAEDHQFFLHNGFRLRALARALWQNWRAGRIISGGSTITQQLVRQLYPIRPGVPGKLKEIWLAMRLEHTLSKTAILEHYINRIPFGNLNFGIEAAARFYFNRPPAHLSLAQASFLAALPQAPGRLNPLKNRQAALQRQRRILLTLRRLGWIDSLTYAEAMTMPVQLAVSRQTLQAPHVVLYIAQKISSMSPQTGIPQRLSLTIDGYLQRDIERILQQELKALKSWGAHNASAVVIDNRTGEILAWVGSPDFFDQKHHGQIDGVRMLRQPGSTLKPFIYLLALKNGYTAASLLPDVRLDAGTPGGFYLPRNYDHQYHGPVRLRQALANSYNIPAVYLAQQFGVNELLYSLRQAGFQSLNQNASYYGPGLVLGNGEVRLLELTRAYAGLARGGRLPPLRLSNEAFPVLPEPYRHPARFAAESHAAVISHILSDAQARVPAFGEDNALRLPFECAAKTGTTKNYRDSWTVGFTADYSVGVWVGNFNGKDMRGITGMKGAAPIFRDIMLLLHRRRPPRNLPLPESITERRICALSGQTPRPFCPSVKSEIFVEGTDPQTACRIHRLLPHPQTGELFLAAVYPPQYQHWAQSQGLPQPLFIRKWQPTTAPDVPLADHSVTDLRIRFPNNGDIFKMDPTLPRQFQQIQFQAVASSSVQQVVWRLNGRIIARTARPFAIFWPLNPGQYELQLQAGSARSPRIRFRVLP